jgi:threonine aldolase
MVDRLAEDHANARRLAEGLAQLPALLIEPTRVQTNIVIFELPGPPGPEELARRMAERNVDLIPIGGPRLRAVTHYGVTAGDIDRALEAFGQALA